MWVFLRDCFVSIVEHEHNTRLLYVRARVSGDIERLFPEAEVVELPSADYRFRAAVSRERVAQVMDLSVRRVDYTAFESDLPEPRREAYFRVWSAMRSLQEDGMSQDAKLFELTP